MFKMKHLLVIGLVFSSVLSISAQRPNPINNSQKGQFYFYWGWNYSGYTKSNISFSGDDYNFELKKVKANDRQSDFDANVYLNPANMTIPQYNFRMGYFINNTYNISFGIDHMKYVVNTGQEVTIDGCISEIGNPFLGEYANDKIVLSPDFLKYEHTDGLNYVNVELRRLDKLWKNEKVSFNLVTGLGAGICLPKTNVTLMGGPRNDEFHLAGFGMSGVAGLNIRFLKYLFIQTEIKGGYLNLPDVLTTPSDSDKASQQFGFIQVNAVFGAQFQLTKPRKRALTPKF